MRLKAALNLLLIFPLFFANLAHALSFEQEVSDSLLKRDWPNLVLLLKPKEGQNFEHDLTLAKAYLALERRAEAVTLLKPRVQIAHPDERASQLFHLTLTQFFSQETSNLYFEAVHYLSGQHWTEAKDKLDQAAAREPGHGWVLLRQIQLDLVLGAKTALEDRMKVATEESLPFPELKVYRARVAYLSDEEDFLKAFTPIKDVIAKNEWIYLWHLDALLKAEKTSELEALQSRVLKDHPRWSSALLWFLHKQKEKISEKDQSALLAQLKLNLTSRADYEQQLDSEGKKTQYFYLLPETYDVVKVQLDRLLKNIKG